MTSWCHEIPVLHIAARNSSLLPFPITAFTAIFTQETIFLQLKAANQCIEMRRAPDPYEIPLVLRWLMGYQQTPAA